MSRIFLENPINEGYNDVGTIDVTITEFEVERVDKQIPVVQPTIERPASLLFQLKFEDTESLPVPTNYVAKIGIKVIDSETFEYHVHPNNEGFVNIDTPSLPIVVIDTGSITKTIRTSILGPLDSRTDECYIKLIHPVDPEINLYTLISDFAVKDGFFCVYDGNETYYKVYTSGEVEIDPDEITAIYISSWGLVYGYNIDLSEWIYLLVLPLAKFQYPENLTLYEDGFYLVGTSGTQTQGNIGGTGFVGYSVTVNNREPYYVNAGVEVVDENDDPVVITPESLNNLLPGVLNYSKIEITGSLPSSTDTSPDLDDLEGVAGTFSELRTFLTTKGLTTINKMRGAGPLSYITGIDSASPTIPGASIIKIQAHIDLFTINPNLEQNEYLIDEGYGSLYKIANSDRAAFIDSVEGGSGINRMRAAQLHEVASKGLNLFTNVLAANLADRKMEVGTIDDVTDSTFGTILGKAVNSCGCDDCQSNISPFSYLFDLINYSFTNIKISGNKSADLKTHAIYLETKFLQSFGKYKVECDTLHDVFCRVRLVTEVLEAAIPSGTHLILDKNRSNFLWLVYTNILARMGTSVQELRDIQTMPDGEGKISAGQKVADRLGLPLYDPYSSPPSSVLTAVNLWLSLTGSGGTLLDSTNLEALTGFRSTKRSVLLLTPTGTITNWQLDKLLSLWKETDYPFTSYSRETLDTTTPSSTVFQSTWKPIIDPDIIGWDDMTFLASDAAKDLYVHRKNDTDEFLSYCVNDNSVKSQTSVDLNNRILKVVDRNLTSHLFENDLIWIENDNGVSANTWDPFTVISKNLNLIDTDILLKKNSPGDLQPAMFQPYGANPTLRYRRKIAVPTGAGSGIASGNFTINFSEDVIEDRLSGGYIKLSSFDGTTTSYYDGSTTPALTFVSSTSSTVTLNLSGAPAGGFTAGTLSFVYEVEVPLYTKKQIDPVLLVDWLFLYVSGTPDQRTWEYMLMSPDAPGLSDHMYTVWTVLDWQGITGDSNYLKLKNLYNLILSGSVTEEQLLIITIDLRLNMDGFNRVMQILISCEKYLSSMFTEKEPSLQELYELASLVRNCAKPKFREIWVKEEILHTPTGGSEAMIVLNQRHFWKSITEPKIGSWDPTLQTLPSSTLTINTKTDYIPIIDPEIISKSDMLNCPGMEPYLALWDDRKQFLEDRIAELYDTSGPWSTHIGITIFESLFKYVANGVATISYSSLLLPYTSLTEIEEELGSSVTYNKLKAKEKLWDVFRLSDEEFLNIMKVKAAYESNNPTTQPSAYEIDKAYRQLISGYKRIHLYNGATFVWINEEVIGVTIGSLTVPPVKYYNVVKMQLAIGRGNVDERAEWQKTLELWNRRPFIHPDYVPAENLKNFTSSSWTFQTWDTIKTNLATDYNTINSEIKPISSNTVSNAFDKFTKHLNRAISRADNSTTLIGTDYLVYFMDIAVRENNGEDIRPYLEQLCIGFEEYRFLNKVYTLLEGLNSTAPSSTSPLLDSEVADIADIIIHIKSHFQRYEQVWNEFKPSAGGPDILVFDEEEFQLFKPSPINFPANELPQYNKWRSPSYYRTEWRDLLESRIDRKRTTLENWKTLLEEVEERTMPYMRDALIKELTLECESHEQAAERLAKKYFIETRDNCCMKHTRISFAIETMQGFLFALKNGLYDSSLSSISLHAQNFDLEWKWIGSYSSWRAAVFVFIYPENLLHPLLKRKQSHGFRKLAEKLSSASRLSPQEACDVAKDYQRYLEDIKNMEIMFSTNAFANVPSEDINVCCGESAGPKKYFTYYFGQIVNTGRVYYCAKDFGDKTENALGFWEPIPIEGEYINLLSCNYLGDPQQNTEALWLFYARKDKGKLKIGCLKKSISDPNSEWIQGEVGELPQYGGYDPVHVVACQASTGLWYKTSFIFTYYHGNKLVFRYNTYDHISDVFNTYIPQHISTQNTSGDFDTGFHAINGQARSAPWTAVSHSDGAAAVAFEDDVMFFWPGLSSGIREWWASFINTDSNGFKYKIIGLFESQQDAANTFVVVLRDGLNKVYIRKYVISLNLNSVASITYTQGATTYQNSASIQQIDKILPIHKHIGHAGIFGVRTITNDVIGCHILNNDTPPSITILDAFRLNLRIQNSSITVGSVECLGNLISRQLEVKNNIQTNSLSAYNFLNFTKMQVLQEYLSEAYFYVPLLLALDQQKRGQYPSALNWYRTIYDFTNDSASNRKIFYGLKQEESITNSYEHYKNWLLDPLNPHLIAGTRTNAHTKYVLMNLIQCLYGYADREFTLDTIESVPKARKLYTEALDLMKVHELKINSNSCLTTSKNCIDTSGEFETARIMPNLYLVMQNKLSTLGNADDIESVTTALESIFTSATEANLPGKYSLAFDAINAALDAQPDPVIEDVETVLDGVQTRTDNAIRYVFANGNTSEYNTQVQNTFTRIASELAGVPVEEALDTESQARFAWLEDPTPTTGVELGFEFANASGQQYFEGELSFNPIAPNSKSYKANFDYSNAAFAVGVVNQASFTPLIDYKFCIPQNPIYKSLELKGHLELFKLFNCRNIAGMVRELDVYSAATDSSTGMPVIGASGNLILPGLNAFTPTQYRFKVLLERAKQICEQAKQMENIFLAAMEKEDSENYSQLQARQGIETARATVKLQDLRITQAKDESKLASFQLDKVNFIQLHFSDLIAQGLLGYEQDSLAALESSISLLNESASLQNTVSQMYLAQAIAFSASTSSDITTQSAGLSIGAIAASIGADASSYSTLSSIESIKASIASQLASYERRNQEWEFQRDLASHEIKMANQQIKIAEDNIRIVGQEREIAQLNVEHATDSYEFIKNKFTNAALYNWMGNILEGCYSFMLNLSTAIAKSAEGQLYFERQEQAGPFILNDYWETPTGGSTSLSSGGTDRRGLTGSARLMVDITRLEQHAFDTNKRKLQLTKVISLSNNFPTEFKRFKETGVLNFELTNKLFDYDFPGHYLRLINGIKTTVVGLIPVYDGIKATLTTGSTSYTVIGGNVFQKTPIRRLELDSVALTSAIAATGVFEMQPIQGELLNPFEGMGLESRWEFKMPQFSNRIDYENIADVLVTVEYTALDSFQYRYQVLQELDNRITFNRGFSMRNDFPDQWFELGEAEGGPDYFDITFGLRRENYPVGVNNLKLNGDIIVYFVRQDGYTEEIKDVEIKQASTVSDFNGRETVDGKLSSSALGNSPVVSLKMVFKNNFTNRELFTKGYVKDILIVVKCKAELKSYPI